ncbi:MAG TPA: 23S rRNA (pseudouridine(1915)-N(3))-methyltransferase RlmH [Terracidiphilus sp.]|jgi:23S rRNA (pseudouridine1915-N3)-methyltransferase
MQFSLAHIGSRATASDEFNSSTLLYVQRMSRFVPTDAVGFRTEEAFFEWASKRNAKVPALIVLLDSEGRQMTSEAFAAWLGARRDESTRHIVFAVGPADGWSKAGRQHAHLVLSLGPMTMAHALARLVMAEQLYRACTILARHPYHSGH